MKVFRRLLVCSAFMLGLPAWAQGMPTVDELVRNLGGQQRADPAPQGKTRGWALRDNTGSVKNAAAAHAKKSTKGEGRHSETRIQFEFGSDQLTPQTLQVLDVFAEAINTPELKDSSFVIEGHTDGIGSSAYNLDLSRRRAESVIRYLVKERNVEPSRLIASGKGKSELADNSDPASPANRRVVWITAK